AVGCESRILRPCRCGLEWSAAEQAERTCGVDRVSRDGVARSVDGEEVLTVVADLDPAGCGLQVGEGRIADRGQRPVACDVECRHRAAVRKAVRVRDEELTRIRRPELAPEWTGSLGCVR